MSSEYKPLEYWSKRMEPSSADEVYTNAHCAFLRKYIRPESLVLDYGPGIGRVFQAYHAGQRVIGIDISPLYVSRVIDAAKRRDLIYDHILTYTHSRIPTYLNGYWFDCIVFSEVLLHVPYAAFRTLLRQAQSIARRVLIITWESKDTPQNLAPHCFNHKYMEVFEEQGVKVTDCVPFRDQTFYALETVADVEGSPPK